MSYEIVRNIRVEKNSDNEFYHVAVTSASSNCRPLYYEAYTFGKDKQWTKEEAERTILLEFFHGNLQRGNSRYRQVVQEVKAFKGEELKRYYRLDKAYYSVSRRCWKTEDRSNTRYEQLCKLADKLRLLRDNYAKDVLYNYMIENKGSISSRKVAPFVVIRKSDGAFVAKVGRSKYYTCYGFNQRVIQTSKRIWTEVKTLDFWKEQFIVEPLSAYLMRQGQKFV